MTNVTSAPSRASIWASPNSVTVMADPAKLRAYAAGAITSERSKSALSCRARLTILDIVERHSRMARHIDTMAPHASAHKNIITGGEKPTHADKKRVSSER